jgi:hypothetical protein
MKKSSSTRTRPSQHRRTPVFESKVNECARAPCFAFLASDEPARYIGQVLHPGGGEIINT